MRSDTVKIDTVKKDTLKSDVGGGGSGHDFCRVMVPGKVMLCGEYAVLEGAPALAASVDLHLCADVSTARVASNQPEGMVVSSSLWSAPRSVAADYDGQDLLLEAVAHGMRQYRLTQGAVAIRSELVPSYGIGSSSALRLAVLAAMQIVARGKLDLWEAAEEALYLQRNQQGQASGYDIATQCLGGFVRFQQRSRLVNGAERIFGDIHLGQTAAAPLHLELLVGGRGAPTSSVTKSTRSYLQSAGCIADLFAHMTAFNDTLQAYGNDSGKTAESATWLELGALFAEHRQIFCGAPDYPKELMELCSSISGHGHDWLVKPTGAGGEDALLVLKRHAAVSTADLHGALEPKGWHALGVNFGVQGLTATTDLGRLGLEPDTNEPRRHRLLGTQRPSELGGPRRKEADKVGESP